jgi:hypothetical protein
LNSITYQNSACNWCTEERWRVILPVNFGAPRSGGERIQRKCPVTVVVTRKARHHAISLWQIDNLQICLADQLWSSFTTLSQLSLSSLVSFTQVSGSGQLYTWLGDWAGRATHDTIQIFLSFFIGKIVCIGKRRS